MLKKTPESMLEHTIFIVEATSFETYCLWEKFHKTRLWKQINPGYIVTIGNIENKPINISMIWNNIDGYLIMFWEVVSQVVDMKQVEEWLSKNFNGKWGNGTRNATTNASNFHLCLQAIDELKKC